MRQVGDQKFWEWWDKKERDRDARTYTRICNYPDTEEWEGLAASIPPDSYTKITPDVAVWEWSGTRFYNRDGTPDYPAPDTGLTWADIMTAHRELYNGGTEWRTSHITLGGEFPRVWCLGEDMAYRRENWGHRLDAEVVENPSWMLIDIMFRRLGYIMVAPRLRTEEEEVVD